ncbi:unnamed protein product [Peniophora sp. CBMAI 1063]|nr:unnamed protein product [Peniophora sp. CBMAI 1063]
MRSKSGKDEIEEVPRLVTCSDAECAAQPLRDGFHESSFGDVSVVPESFSYASIVSEGPFSVAQIYFVQWTSSVLALVIFGLFGLTSEARASYWRIICTVGGWFGWQPTLRAHRAHSPLGDIEVGNRPAQNSMSLGLESNPSYIDRNARAQEQDQVVGSGGARVGAENESEQGDGNEEAHLPQATHPYAERPTQPPGGSYEASLGDAAAVV